MKNAISLQITARVYIKNIRQPKNVRYQSIFFVPTEFHLNWLKNMADRAVWNNLIKAKNSQIDWKLEDCIQISSKCGLESSAKFEIMKSLTPFAESVPRACLKTCLQLRRASSHSIFAVVYHDGSIFTKSISKFFFKKAKVSYCCCFDCSI